MTAPIPGATTVHAVIPEQTVAIAPAHLPLPPTTTAQQDLTTAGQRRINLIWEYTQACVAALVVLTNMIVAAVIALRDTPPVLLANGLMVPGVRSEVPTILSSSLFLIVGFYFSRTNHVAIGGIGEKPMTEYRGR